VSDPHVPDPTVQTSTVPDASTATATAPDPTMPPPGADGIRALDPRIVLVWRFGLIPSLILPATVLGGMLARLLPVPPLAVVIPLAVLIGLVIGPLQTLRWRRWSWRLTDSAVEIRSGVITRRHVVVPHFRVQQIDVLEGPIERLLGLATLTLTTASAAGSVSIPGLLADAAPAVRTELVARAARANEELGRSGRDAV
jgi:membrane protein YdbS with pleckstrin-like domain